MLKREIHDIGYQSSYESQGDFYGPIERMLFNLAPQVKNDLLAEWRKARPSDSISYSNFHSAYTLLVLEEIVERAAIGAMRTWNWS